MEGTQTHYVENVDRGTQRLEYMEFCGVKKNMIILKLRGRGHNLIYLLYSMAYYSIVDNPFCDFTFIYNY